jgi:large subunit ribosomal protein L19
MAISAKHKDQDFGVGDKIKVWQKIKEQDKERLQAFEGMVIKIRGEEINKSFTVRKIGAANIGIERTFPLQSPVIQKIEVVRKGQRGVRRAKLYYIRDKSKREIEKIFSRAKIREASKEKAKTVSKPAKSKKTIKNGKVKKTKKNK